MSITDRVKALEGLVARLLKNQGCKDNEHKYIYSGQFGSSNGSPWRHEVWATCSICEKQIHLIERDNDRYNKGK